MRWLTGLALLAACAAAPRAPRASIDVWVPQDVEKNTREQIAKALAGHPPPARSRLPANEVVRRVRYVLPENPDWRELLAQARGYARSAGADAVLLLPEEGWTRESSGEWVVDPSMWTDTGLGDLVVVKFEIVRYR